MKIQSSQTQLTGLQKNASIALEIQQVSVRELSAEPAEGNNSAGASVTLSLTNRVSEEQRIATQSTVRVAEIEGGGDDQGAVINYHESLKVAKHVIEQSSEMELTVREVVPSGGRSGNGFQIGSGIDLRVEVVSLLTQTSQQGLTFEALGQVTTEDGRRIDFMLALDFERSIKTEQVNQFVGNRNLIDPLMINLNGGAVELSDLTFEFDLDGDGETEQISQTLAGSGFLVFDKNHNGEIDNGSEMFGPQSGQGFAELSQYDDDGNGWIDENDAIYAELGVMSFGSEGRITQSLADAGVGAIFLGSTASDYDLNTEEGIFAGRIKQSGVALGEDGRVLLMQEVHLAKRTDDEVLNVNLNGFQFDPLSGVQMSDIRLDAQALEIDSPLGFFQFDDLLIASREETQVMIESSENVSQNSFSNSSSNRELDLSLSVATAGQQTFDRAQVAEELSHWVASAMEDFQPNAIHKTPLQQSNAFFEIEQVKPPVFDQALTDMDLEAMKLESSLGAMRSMVDSLREMRLQMSQSQSKMSLYHSVNRFK